MKDNNKDDGFMDMVDKAVNFYQENREMFESLAPDEDTVKIDGKSPLKSATVDDDMVYVTIEVPGDGLDSIRIDEDDDGVIIGMNGENIKAEVPEDVNTDNADASLNNGVLQVKIPREGGEE